MSAAMSNKADENFMDVLCQSYDGLDYDDRIPRECGLLNTYLEDILMCSSREVLEIGYGDGSVVAFFLKRGFHVTGLDNELRIAQKLKQNLSKLGDPATRFTSRIGDVSEYEVEEGKYAVIVISYVLHFLCERSGIAVLDRLKRSLAPQGVILVRVHHDDFRKAAEGDGRYKHFFKEPELDACFAQGFDVLFSSKFSRIETRNEYEVGAKAKHLLGLPVTQPSKLKYVSLEYLARKDL